MVPDSKRGKVTLEDVARAAKCSKNTASLALRDSPRISQKLRGQIRDIANRFGYTTDYAARNLRVRRSGLIGIYTRRFNDAVRTELVNHLLAELHTAQYRPVLGIDQGQNGPCFDSLWMQTFRELRVEALVILWEEASELPEWTHSIPTVLVGCTPREDLRCDYLALDRREAGRLGTRHLLSRGHRDILVGGGTRATFTAGCLDALSESRVKPYGDPMEITVTDMEQSRLAGYNVARQKSPPTGAVFCDSGYAAGFLRGVLDARRRVPEDLAIVGYDYFPWAQMLSVPLTTIEQPIRQMATTAVELVRKRLAETDRAPVHIVQPHNLVIRESS